MDPEFNDRSRVTCIQQQWQRVAIDRNYFRRNYSSSQFLLTSESLINLISWSGLFFQSKGEMVIRH